MYVITDVSATLDGEDLGTPARAPRPIEFGDIKNMPLYMHSKGIFRSERQNRWRQPIKANTGRS